MLFFNVCAIFFANYTVITLGCADEERGAKAIRHMKKGDNLDILTLIECNEIVDEFIEIETETTKRTKLFSEWKEIEKQQKHYGNQ